MNFFWNQIPAEPQLDFGFFRHCSLSDQRAVLVPRWCRFSGLIVCSCCGFLLFLFSFLCCVSESCSLRPRSTSCWSTTLMPSSTIRSTATLPVNTAWPCSRRRCSARPPKSARLQGAPRPTYRLRCVRAAGECFLTDACFHTCHRTAVSYTVKER